MTEKQTVKHVSEEMEILRENKINTVINLYKPLNSLVLHNNYIKITCF